MAGTLAGRTYDVAVFEAGAPSAVVSLTAAVAGGGSLVTGPLKLAQRVLLELLTDYGSMLYAPTRGCGLMAALTNGAALTDVSVQQAFSLAASQVKRSLAADAAAAPTPLDETLDQLDLVSVALAPDQAALTIAITSAAGAAARLIVPLAI